MSQTANQPLTKHSYVWLDLIRALAAMAVFLQHLRTLIFSSYSNGPAGFFKKTFYFLTGFSHEAVVIFFVLSGFFITGVVVNAWENGKFSFLNYGLDRLIRLWVVLIPGLIFTFIADRMGLHWFGTNAGYTGNINFTGDIVVAANLNWPTFLGNIFFLQTILVNPFGSNSPLWSLSNEFWYYVLFPTIFFIFYHKKIVVRIFLAILALGVGLFIGQSILIYFSIWLIGSALFLIKKNFPAPSGRVKYALLGIGSVAFVMCFYVLRIGGSLGWLKDLVSALVTAVLCYVGLYSDIQSKIISRIIRFFSGISYSLYAIHLPLCLLITSWLTGSGNNWGLYYFLLYLFIALVVLGLTVIFWYCFESRYIQVRTYIKKRFFSRAGPALVTN